MWPTNSVAPTLFSMTKYRRRMTYLSGDQHEALVAIAETLGIEGQRGARYSPLIQWLGRVAEAAPNELAAALVIAGECANGGDWDELVNVIRPDLTD